MRTWYIYKITNLITNKSYVGQRQLPKKYNSIEDDSYMGSGTYLQLSVKRHGVENFKKEILKEDIKCQTAANIFEQIFIKKEDSLEPLGYNLKSSSLCNYVFSESTKRKMSESHKGKEPVNKGKKMSLEARESMSLAHIGQKHSEETKKKRADSCRGKKRTPEFCERLSKINTGKRLSRETIEKILETKKRNGSFISPPSFKGRLHSEESKKKISDTLKKRVLPPMSEETRKKLSDIGKTRLDYPPSRKGCIVSEETKKKISDFWKRKREIKKEINDIHP